MKTMKNISRLLLVLSCVAVLSGCDKRFVPVSGGDEIRFSGRAQGSGSYATRAFYAGDRYNDTEDENKTKEHIYWEVGDVVRVFCAQATHPNYADATVLHAADYKVVEVQSDPSKAYIELDVDRNINGLHWSDDTSEEHVFYGVYPSPAVSGICTQISGDDGEKLTGTLPKSQNTLTGALASDDDDYVLAPDLKWQLMTAGPVSHTPANFPATDEVFLTFKPLTTAIQFTLRNDNTDAITIQSLSLLSAGTQISGDFTISDVQTASGDGFPVVAGSGSSSPTDDEKSVLLELASPYVSLAAGATITFTFFLAPVSDIKDLTFQITMDDGTKSLRLGYTDGTFLSFPRCKKSFVNLAYTPSANLLILNVNIADWNKENKDEDMDSGSVLTFDDEVKPWASGDAGNITYTD